MKTKQKGFSIIEILVASSVVVVSLISIALLTTKSLQLSQAAQQRQKAISYTRQIIEQVRYNKETQAWSEFIGGGYDNDLPNLTGTEFNQTVIITKKGTSSQPEQTDKILQLTVKVNWTDSNGAHEVSQETFLSKNI